MTKGIAISGSHRSGTSSIAQYFHFNGVPAGLDLIDGNEFNKHGYFEDWEVVKFHDAVLARNGLSWNSVAHEPVQLSGADVAFCQGYASRRASAGTAWTFKDPRVCKFVEHWAEVLPDLRFLIVYRAPHLVATSQLNRAAKVVARSAGRDVEYSKFMEDPDLALKIWLSDNSALLNLAKRFPNRCAVISHESYLSGLDPLAIAREHLGLEHDSKKAPTVTIDRKLIRRQQSKLYVSSDVLVKRARAVYEGLQALDVSPQTHLSTDIVLSNLEIDPTCARQKLDFMQKVWNEVSLGIKSTEVDWSNAVVTNEDVAQRLREREAQLKSVLEDVGPIVKKLRKSPFKFYFRKLKKRKYKAPLDRLLKQVN
ncbi:MULTISPECIES: hypothetical protein [unclassified Ruegeria]|uniref:hypothetical protein n=1 Tax=unclassified Ruegeria TaxID=2625375 RepID=UPI001492C78F|nr:MULTISPECIES: hypothetical protein [unclassified Ruegeria]NOD47541.1 hypothetical protein [Ruegeria sp. HKCCD5849]NOD53066.1 hypothetical protein [Ruegeria sp. HKCCD5851]NOD66215.1 hypothetical protein [Ruegeria sp. HKCCD7303]